MLKVFRRALFAAIIVFAAFVFFRQASNDRDWTDDMSRLAGVRVESRQGVPLVSIENIRDSSYQNEEEQISYYSDEFDPEKLERIWFLVEPFSKWEAAAHTFFVFDFEGGQTLSFSVEARKEKDEKYSALRGLFREYELYYMFGSERDLILRRTDHLDHDVYMYPVKTTQENMKRLFLSIALEANRLESSPAFYNTITSSCTTTLVKHINDTSPGKVGWWRKEQYLPGLSDQLAYELGLIDTNQSFEETKKAAYIKDKANSCADSPDFSSCLRARISHSSNEIDS